MRVGPKLVLLLGILLSISPCAKGQQNIPSKSVFLLFDQLVGMENTELFEGMEYVERHRMINEKHKFFRTFDFVPSVVTYDGQAYYNIPLKYNVYEDLVVVELQTSKGKKRFRLFEEKLDRFQIGIHEFIDLEKPPGKEGIYELLLEKQDFLLLKKYKKNLKNAFDRQLLYHEFEPEEPEFLLLRNESLITLDRGNILDLFPKKKADVRKFYRDKRRLRKDDPELFLIELFSTFI